MDPFGTSAEVGNKSSGGFDLFGLLKEIGHTSLDVGGLAPGFGAAFDAVNGVWYTAEGDWINAGLSGTSVMPFAGLVSGGGKLISKVIKWGGNLFDWIKGASKVEKAAEGVVDIVKGGLKTVDDLPIGWTKTTNNGFTHIRDANGNIRVRIDPPDAKTSYPHKHLYDETGNSLDINGNIVKPKSPDAHIPIE